MPTATVTREDIVREARACLGTPWRHQGRVPGPKGGLDCAGLLVYVAHALGLSAFDYTGYSRYPDGRRLRAILDAHLDRITLAELREGDILLMTEVRWPCHVAIVTTVEPRWLILHSVAKYRKVVEHTLDTTWEAKIRGAYRFRGLAEARP
jgi:NlpC/P60 family